MKKLLVILGVLLFAGGLWAYKNENFGVDKTSRTTTADSYAPIPDSGLGFLAGIIVGGCSSAAGSDFAVYDSTGNSGTDAASKQVFSIDTSSSPLAGLAGDCREQYWLYRNFTSSITYTNGNAADVTILWHTR